jgi:hypothetical protein
MTLRRVGLILALVSVLAVQFLVIAHAMEHPILDDHPCQLCLHFQGPEHALAPPLQTPQAEVHCKALAVEAQTPTVILPLPDRRIRAPPLSG